MAKESIQCCCPPPLSARPKGLKRDYFCSFLPSTGQKLNPKHLGNNTQGKKKKKNRSPERILSVICLVMDRDQLQSISCNHLESLSMLPSASDLQMIISACLQYRIIVILWYLKPRLLSLA